MIHFFNPPKKTQTGFFFYLARHVVTTHLEHLQLVSNLLKIFGTPSSVFVQLGYTWNFVVYSWHGTSRQRFQKLVVKMHQFLRPRKEKLEKFGGRKNLKRNILTGFDFKNLLLYVHAWLPLVAAPLTVDPFSLRRNYSVEICCIYIQYPSSSES